MNTVINEVLYKFEELKEMNRDSVCAVVVTYNRKELLIECLKALKNQSRHLNAIYIVDNASTDGTPELLVENGRC